jgi:uncharacterized membrane protein
MVGCWPGSTDRAGSRRREDSHVQRPGTGLDLLEILATRGESRVADLAAELKASRATVLRVLAALERRG